MESKTPLTDKEAFCPDDGHGPVVDADFARRLERALAVAESALNSVAAWREGDVVGSSFDEPGSAGIARAALAQIEELRR